MTDAIKTDSETENEETPQATVNLIGNKFADKIASASKKFSRKKIMMLIMQQKYQKK